MGLGLGGVLAQLPLIDRPSAAEIQASLHQLFLLKPDTPQVCSDICNFNIPHIIYNFYPCLLIRCLCEDCINLSFRGVIISGRSRG